MTLDAKVPEGPIEQKWDNHKFDIKLVNPANKRRFEIVVVGTGLAGASAAATLGELGPLDGTPGALFRRKAVAEPQTPATAVVVEGTPNARTP